jgi:LuxR family transcriptional regulator, maltose regulon positive regulatory protein
MQKADLLIHTKLHLPFIRAEVVHRPRLQKRIMEGLRGPLTLITAPAGFGKTTLVASCISSCGLPAAWLSLDKSDNQDGRFLTYLVAALQKVNPSAGNEAEKLLKAVQPASPEIVLTSLINELDVANVETALVLDDYQLIDSRAVHDDVSFLLEHCPQSFHILIVTRSDPPLPLARLRGRGQTVELRAVDLRFTGQEAAQFLNDVMQLQLDSESVKALADRTEGWIAGLQMAALSMRDREDVLGFIKGFSGTSRYILDYLLEEVLARQTPEIQRFLLYTSILDRLSAQLCDAVLSIDASDSIFHVSSASMLEYLERENIFLVPLDDQRIWYRYHHLFADLLRTELQKSLVIQGIAQLHLRAALWFEQNGSTLEAIHQASLASDFDRVERLIEQNYFELMNHGEMISIKFWTKKLSKELIYSRPRLCIYEALSRSWFGQLDEADVLLKEAEKRIRSQHSDPEMHSMLGFLIYVQSRVAALHGNMRRAIALNLSARDNTPADNLAMQLTIGITLGLEYFLDGDFIRAVKTLEKVIEWGYSFNDITDGIAAYGILARLYALQGRLHKAYEQHQKAEQWLNMATGSHLGAKGLIEVGIADVLYEWNDLNAALVHIEQGLDLIPLWGKTDDMVMALTTLSRIHFAQGNRHSASEAMEKAIQLIQACGVFSEARNAVETAQIRFFLAHGDRRSAAQWADSFEQNSHQKMDDLDDPFRFRDEAVQIARVRVFMAQNKLDDAMGLISTLEENAQSFGRIGRLIEIKILKALSMQKMGNIVRANNALAESLALAEPEGYLRVFLDEGQPIQMLLNQWVTCTTTNPLHKYATRLSSQLDAELQLRTDREKPSPANNFIDPLSARELEVLKLMALGRTNQEIARLLVVAPGTIKAHAASIYRKLDVANRTEAVARARQFGLLP